MKLRYKLLLPMVALLLLTFVVLYYLLISGINQLVFTQRHDSLVALTASKLNIFDDADLNDDPQKGALHSKFAEFVKIDPSIFRIKVWDKKLTVIHSDLLSLENTTSDSHLDLVKAAFSDNAQVQWIRQQNNIASNQGYGPYLLGIIPLRDRLGETRFVIELFGSFATNIVSLKSTLEQIMILTFVALLTLIIMEYLILSRYILRPIKLLNNKINALGRNDFDDSTVLNTHDEFASFEAAFNSMTHQLKGAYVYLEKKVRERTKELEVEKHSLEKKVRERTKELEVEKNSLEKKVEERTATLREQVAEIESDSKLMIGREIKMIELKKENAEFKNRVDVDDVSGENRQ